MRYAKVEKLVRLVVRMLTTETGLSLGDIEELCGVNRRAAEQLRDDMLRIVPEVRAFSDAEGRERWRIPGGSALGHAGWEPPELAALAAAIEASERDGQPDQAQQLRGLCDRIGALMREDVRARITPDLEVLCAAQGRLMRAGPLPALVPEAVEQLRWAILSRRRVTFEYTPRGPATREPSVIHPYGFLSGFGQYLVGFSERSCGVQLYRLSRIASVEVLDGDFERDPDFDLQRYAENSFGVVQEEPVDVVWLFDPELAPDAAEFEFHPSQKIEWGDDGSLLVRFRAGGLVEMAWHLFRWGPGVEVVEPAALREKLVMLLSEAFVAHAPVPHFP